MALAALAQVRWSTSCSYVRAFTPLGPLALHWLSLYRALRQASVDIRAFHPFLYPPEGG